MTWEDHGGELALAVALYVMIRFAEAMVPKAVLTRLNARIARRPAVLRSPETEEGNPEGKVMAIRHS